MAVLDISGDVFGVGVDTPLPTATVLIHDGKDENASVEFSAKECIAFAHALLRAASLLDPHLISYNVKQFIDSEV